MSAATDLRELDFCGRLIRAYDKLILVRDLAERGRGKRAWRAMGRAESALHDLDRRASTPAERARVERILATASTIRAWAEDRLDDHTWV